MFEAILTHGASKTVIEVFHCNLLVSWIAFEDPDLGLLFCAVAVELHNTARAKPIDKFFIKLLFLI